MLTLICFEILLKICFSKIDSFLETLQASYLGFFFYQPLFPKSPSKIFRKTITIQSAKMKHKIANDRKWNYKYFCHMLSTHFFLLNQLHYFILNFDKCVWWDAWNSFNTSLKLHEARSQVGRVYVKGSFTEHVTPWNCHKKCKQNFQNFFEENEILEN